MAIKRVGNITINYTVPETQTQLYNVIGRTSGNQAATQQNTNQGGGDNFFAKRGRSIENTFGTTGSSIVSAVNDRIENDKTNQLLKDNKTRMNDIAKKYGYNSYHDVWDARDKAKESGDTATLEFIDNTINPELKAQANANAAKANEKAANYEDYRKNDYISNKINQDRGKFAGSAINTLSTAADLTGLSSTPLSNAIQGGIEGVADELEQNGLENFDWGRAGQNAAIGATTGAVTGALNAGISNSLAKRAAAKGLTNTATKAGIGSALKNGARTIATGAARGALSGAVGGATGAGLQSAMNGVEFGQGVQNALQGAVQGAQQGAVTGGIMAGANAAFGKTNFGKQLQNAKTNWDQSGNNFDERLTNTLTSGDSAVGDWLMNRRQSRVLGAAGNLGNRVQDVSDTYRTVDPLGNRREYTPDQVRQLIDEYENYKAPEVLSSNSTDEVTDAMGEAGVTLSEIFRNRNGGQFDPYSRADGEAFNKWVQQTKANLSTPTTARGWAKKAGQRIVEDVNNSNLGNRVKDVGTSSYSQAARFVNDVLTGKLKGASDADVLRAFEKLPPSAQQDTITLGKDFLDDDFVETLAGTVRMQNRLGATTRQNSAFYIENENPTYMADDENYIRGYLGDKIVDENARSSYNDAARFITDIVSGDSKYKTDVEVLNNFRKLPADSQQDVLKIGRNWLSDDFMNTLEQSAAPTTAKGWAKKAGQRIVEDLNNTNLGNRIIDVNGQKVDTDNLTLAELNDYRDRLQIGAELAPEYANQYKLQEAAIADEISNRLNEIQAGKFRQTMPEDIRNMQIRDYNAYADGEMTAPETYVEEPAQVTRTTTPVTQVDPWDRVAQEAGYSNYDEVLQRYAEANPNTKINPRGMAGQVLTWMDQNPNTPTTASGWAKRAGQRMVEDVNNSNLGLRVKDTATEDPSKRLYNALVGNQEPVATAKANTLPETDMGIEEATAKTSKAGKLRNAAGLKYAAQYGTIDKPTAKATNPAKTFTELAELGFTKPADVERMAGAMTGSNGEMSALVRNVVNASDPVDTFAGEKSGQTLDDYINLSIQKHGLDGIREGNAVKSQIDALMGSLPSHAEGSIDFQDTPEAVFKLTQQLDAEAANYRGKSGMNYGTTTPDKLRAAQVISDVSGLLKDRIYSNSDVKQALTPEVAQNLKSYAPNNKAWAKYVDETVMNMKNVKDLRSAQANWVNANKIIDNAYINSMTYGGRVGGSGSIPLTKRGLAGAILDKTINSDTGLRAQAKLLNKAADFVDNNPGINATANPDTAAGWAKQAGRRAAEDLGNTNLGNRIQDVSGTEVVNPQIASPAELATMTANYNPSTQLYNAIGRTEGLTNAEQANTADYLVDAVQEAEVVPSTGSTLPASTGSTALYSSLAGTPTTTTQTTTNTGYFQPTGDYWTDIIASAMSAAINANDADAFATLYGMYQDQLANLQKQASAAQSSSQQKLTSTQQRANAAMNSLERLSGMEPDTAYNLSSIPLVGNIATFGGNDYEAEAKSLAQQIGYMVSGSNIKDSEAENIGKSYVPQPWDNEQVRQNKLRRAYEIIQRYQNGYTEN